MPITVTITWIPGSPKSSKIPNDTVSLSPISQTKINTKWKTPDKNEKLYQNKEEMGINVLPSFKKCLIFPNSLEGATPYLHRVKNIENFM